MVAAMVATLVGEFVVLEKRPRVLSIINAAHSFGYLASAPIAALLVETAGWRAIPGGFLFPVSSAVFFVAIFILPSSKPVDPSAVSLVKKRYKEGFKEIFKNKSAVGLLVGLMLAFISGSIGIYSISFLKLKFQLATALGGPILMAVAALGVFGALTAGAVVPRFGRKNILISCGFLAGLFTIVGFSMPEMWLAVAFRFLAVLFSAIAGTAGSLLAIELVPKYRATLMSLFGVFGASGAIIGVILGGRVLDATKSFPMTGIVLGAFGIVSAVECFFLVVDPVRTKQTTKRAKDVQ
jgi:predicted MFS family arabinose efflux permease